MHKAYKCAICGWLDTIPRDTAPRCCDNMQMVPVQPRKTMKVNLGRKSISDDDLCSDCTHCQYRPGELSECKVGWPGQQDEDGYVETCKRFQPVSGPAQKVGRA